jgi:hypothetical protein
MAGFLTSPRRRAIWFFYVDLPYRYPAGLTAVGILVATGIDPTLGSLALVPGLASLGGLAALGAKAPSLAQVDAWFAEDLARLIERGRQRLDPDRDQLRGSILHLTGPLTMAPRRTLFLTEQPRRITQYAYRSPRNRVLLLFPMERHLGIYSCNYDSVRDITSHVEVHEYNYKDIVAVSLSETLELHDGQKAVEYSNQSGERVLPTQTFELSFSNGQKLSVPVTAAVPSHASGGMTELDKTVASIRALLRSRQ